MVLGTALGGNTTINGGTINIVNARTNAAGIGGGINGSGGNITINGGTIIANGGQNAAGIGGGLAGDGGKIVITGGDVIAKGGISGNEAEGDNGYYAGAGIGGGSNASGGDIRISGGTVNAYGGTLSAAIGAGGFTGADGGNLTITGGTVRAYAGSYGNGLGNIGTGAHFNFSTTDPDTNEPGNAIIITDSISEAGSSNSMTTGSDDWSGIIDNGNTFEVYGNVTLQQNYDLDSDKPLIIRENSSLTIPEDKTFTVSEGSSLDIRGSLYNEGILINKETITASESATFNNSGSFENENTLQNHGDLNNFGTINNEGTIDNQGSFINEGSVTGAGNISGNPVYVKAEALTVTPSSTSVLRGSTVTLQAKLSPENALPDTFTWSSDNEAVAMVDQNGHVYSVTPGIATITVYADQTGLTAACRVQVTEPPYTGDYNYEVKISESDNGTITIPKEDQWANEGEEITITVTPNEGYMLEDLRITANGTECSYVDNGDGTYTFTMPESRVTITASFVEDPNYEEPNPEPEPIDLPFNDVDKDDWFYEPVQYVYSKELMTGITAPDLTTNRAMIVSILYRLEGSPAVKDGEFSDVKADAWYAESIAWAAGEGIVSGFGDGTFKPNDPLTREQMASILYRYAEYRGVDVSARRTLDAYSDAGAISLWATDVMSWANAEGLIAGVTNTTLAPQGTATRAQVAAMLECFVIMLEE